MIVPPEDIGNVTAHGEATGAVSVVPCEVNTSKLGARPVRGDFVVRREGMQEVVGVLAADVFNTEIIHDKDKNDRSPFVAPEARRSGALVVAMRFKAGCEEVVGQFASLLEPVDPF